MCVPVCGFSSSFARIREVKLDEINFAEPPGETYLAIAMKVSPQDGISYHAPGMDSSPA